MKKLSISKSSYSILTSFFYIAALSGLLWQSIKISIVYFKYETVTDVKVYVPGETNYGKLALNLCFNHHQVMNISLYYKMLKNHSIYKNYWRYVDADSEKTKADFILGQLTIGERFNISLDPDDLFMKKVETIVFIHGNQICYHRRFFWGSYSYINSLSDHYNFYIAISNWAMIKDYQNAEPIEGVHEKNATVFNVASAAIRKFRLTAPYRDMCVNYTLLNFSSRLHAFESCLNEYQMKISNQIYPSTKVSKNDTKYFNYTITRDMFLVFFRYLATCYKKYKNYDCDHDEKITLISERKMKNVDKISRLGFYNDRAKQPSIDVVSKPQLDKIEYVTFICGAIGTWLGISFMDFNPINFLFRVKQDDCKKTNVGAKTDGAGVEGSHRETKNNIESNPIIETHILDTLARFKISVIEKRIKLLSQKIDQINHKIE